MHNNKALSIDPLRCPKCGSNMHITKIIYSQDEIREMLERIRDPIFFSSAA
jgi:hypothetical protein